MQRPEDWPELIKNLNHSYGLELAEQLSADGLEAVLAEKLNSLIHSDFNALIGILYRIDVDESRLKDLLKTNDGEDAGKIIARLIIERQRQKVQTRKVFSNPKEDTSKGGDEKGANTTGAGDWQDV
jgi:uncharacterized protein YtpQ (UPF0354 family)